MVSMETAELSAMQIEMFETQNKIWKTIEKQVQVLHSNFHKQRDCTRLFFFSNQQMSFNFDTVALVLSISYSDVKSYHSSLHSFPLNKINSILSILRNHLPTSFVTEGIFTDHFIVSCS